MLSARLAHRSGLILGVCALSLGGIAQAAPVEWVDIITGTDNFPSTVTIAQFGGAYAGTTMNYTGAALGRNEGSGVSVWSPGGPFISGTVSNAPANQDFIELADFAATHTITFNVPVTNPVMAVIGLGTGLQPAQWNFDSPFDVLSFGAGSFGGPGTLTEQVGDVLEGFNGTGTIQFQGTFTSISWTATNAQPWQNGGTPFIVGLLVPAPGVAGALAMLGLVGLRRRR